jgi:purine nucleosidase
MRQLRSGRLRLFILALLWMLTTPSWGQAPPEATVQKVILDTDIGSNVDDAYELTLLASLRRAKVLGITTVSGATDERARLAAKLLTKLGGANIPVYAGARSNQALNPQCEWASGFNSRQLKKAPAIEFLYRQIEHSPGEITLIAIGPLTNLADLLRRHPITAKQIKRIVLMGGAVNVGYDSKPPPVPEHNIRSDPISARTVFQSGASLTMVGLDATAMMQLDEARQHQLLALGTPATDALAALTTLVIEFPRYSTRWQSLTLWVIGLPTRNRSILLWKKMV